MNAVHTPETLNAYLQNNPMEKNDVERILRENINNIYQCRMNTLGRLVPINGHNELFSMYINSKYPQMKQIIAVHEMLHIHSKTYINRTHNQHITPQEQKMEDILSNEAKRICKETDLDEYVFSLAKSLNKIR